MTDEEKTNSVPPSSDAWQEVGKQFEALGRSLATAFRTAWEREENRKRVQSLQAGLEAMVNQIGQAIQEATASPEAHKAKEEAEKVARSVRAAGQQTWQEAQPHLVSALRQLNSELQKAISQLEQEEPAVKSTPPEPPSRPSEG